MLRSKVWLLAFVVAMLAACAGPTMVGDWVNPNFQGPVLRKILVMGISPDSNVRRIFEDQFVAELRRQDVDAIASYRQTQNYGELSEDQIQDIMRRTGANAVAVTRVARVDREVLVNPGSTRVTAFGPRANYWGTHRHDSFYGLYRSAWVTHVPPTIHEFDIYTLETNLWSVDGNELVWSGTTESLATSNVFSEIEKLIGLVIEAWAKRGLI